MDAQHIIEEARKLSLAEQRKLVEALTANISQPETGADDRREQEVLERLVAKGVISEIVAPMSDEEDGEYPPMEIAGEPLSEMIVRERR